MRRPTAHRRAAPRSELRRQRGASAVEFALVAPLVLLFIFAVVEFMLVMMADVTLEAAVTRTQRESRYQWIDARTCSGHTGAVRTSVLNGLSGWSIKPQSLVVTRLAVLGPAFAPADGAVLPCVDEAPGWVIYQLTLQDAGLLGILNHLGVELLQLKRTLAVRNLP